MNILAMLCVGYAVGAAPGAFMMASMFWRYGPKMLGGAGLYFGYAVLGSWVASVAFVAFHFSQ